MHNARYGMMDRQIKDIHQWPLCMLSYLLYAYQLCSVLIFQSADGQVDEVQYFSTGDDEMIFVSGGRFLVLGQANESGAYPYGIWLARLQI